MFVGQQATTKDRYTNIDCSPSHHFSKIFVERRTSTVSHNAFILYNIETVSLLLEFSLDSCEESVSIK